MRSLVLLVLLALASAAPASGNVRLKVDSSSIDFGHVPMFGQQQATIRVWDTSASDIEIDQLQITGMNAGDFKVTQPSLTSLPLFVTAGTNIPTLISIQFQPQGLGARKG